MMDAIRNHARLQWRHSGEVNASIERVFVRLCPVREYDYLPHWACHMVYSESGFAEPGAVFVTAGFDGRDDVWVISEHRAPECVSFVRTHPDRVMHYTVSLQALDIDRVRLQWTQQITALSDAGEAHLAGLEEADFKATIDALHRLMQYELDHGHRAEA